jgi:hypothetical protein
MMDKLLIMNMEEIGVTVQALVRHTSSQADRRRSKKHFLIFREAQNV